MESWKKELYVKNELRHHGILGQKWGQQNGPPYPLDGGSHSASERKAGWRKSLANGGGHVSRKKPVAIKEIKTAPGGGGGRVEEEEEKEKDEEDELSPELLAALNYNNGWFDEHPEYVPGMVELSLHTWNNREVNEETLNDLIAEWDLKVSDKEREIMLKGIEKRELENTKKYFQKWYKEEFSNTAKRSKDWHAPGKDEYGEFQAELEEAGFNLGENKSGWGKMSDENIRRMHDWAMEVVENDKLMSNRTNKAEKEKEKERNGGMTHSSIDVNALANTLAHVGRSQLDGAKIGSGRYRLGSGDRPYQGKPGYKNVDPAKKRATDRYLKEDDDLDLDEAIAANSKALLSSYRYKKEADKRAVKKGVSDYAKMDLSSEESKKDEKTGNASKEEKKQKKHLNSNEVNNAINTATSQLQNIVSKSGAIKSDKQKQAIIEEFRREASKLDDQTLMELNRRMSLENQYITNKQNRIKAGQDYTNELISIVGSLAILGNTGISIIRAIEELGD